MKIRIEMKRKPERKESIMEKPILKKSLAVLLLITALGLANCGKNNYLSDEPRELFTRPADDGEIVDPYDENILHIEEVVQDIPESAVGVHPIFLGELGIPISKSSMGAVDSDPVTGNNPCDDFDGDGIKNSREVVSNPYVSDYPRIVTRISAPITMEIRINESIAEENHTETLEESDLKDTIKNSMENRQYSQFNEKTTPYVTKESWSNDHSDFDSYGYSDSTYTETSSSSGLVVPTPYVTLSLGGGGGDGSGYSYSENSMMASSFSRGKMAEKTVFENVDYMDNLDRNGVEFSDESTERISKNSRLSSKFSGNTEIGANAGIVRASLFIKNTTVNMPARITKVKCTLSFRTPAGKYEGVKTFYLLNEDGSYFAESVYGGEELGPFVIEVDNLSTNEVRRALVKGWIPQIHVVSYKLERVEDSDYNTELTGDNLKIIEETAKARTATIRMSGKDMRELYRVIAFDVEPEENCNPDTANCDPDFSEEVSITPGISLKKALYYILKSRTGKSEQWLRDSDGKELTVDDQGLRWRTGDEEHQYPDIEDMPDDEEHRDYVKGTDRRYFYAKGNNWDMLETYLRCESIRDVQDLDNDGEPETEIEVGIECDEWIRRIGDLEMYNPFDASDNPDFELNEYLNENELKKSKFWRILHNGEYFQGDINDPIWAGERYELVLVDVEDFNRHFDGAGFTPILMENVSYLSTRWNRESNKDEFGRSLYLGKAVKNEVVQLEVGIEKSRFLFEQPSDSLEFGYGRWLDSEHSLKVFNNFSYTFDSGIAAEGLPQGFQYSLNEGTNRIRVNISESDNANFYVVSFWPKYLNNDPLQTEYTTCESHPDSCRRVKFTSQDLRENYGYVFVNRWSRLVDVNGKPVYCNEPGDYCVAGEGGDENYYKLAGIIDGYDETGETIDGTYHWTKYNVSVAAHGTSYGIPSSKESLSGVMDVTIKDPFEEDTGENEIKNVYSGGFSYAMQGFTNGIEIFINEGANTSAEYYRIKIQGPANYSVSCRDSLEIVGHAGRNVISISNPECPAELNADGLYDVKVYAINMHTFDENGEFYGYNQDDDYDNTGINSRSHVLVPYDKYINLRDGDTKPRISTELFDTRAVDLEVNFNDGNGWFKLNLSSNDIAEGEKTINCRYTTYMEHNKQKVYIKFTPPRGTADDYYYNVFMGNRDEVDVYLRTVPRAEYRDTLWPRPDKGFEVYVKDMPDYDTLNYWITHDATDASSVESISDFKINSQTDINSLDSGGFKFSFGSITDLFFSPAVERVYSIRSSLKEGDIRAMANETTHVDNPFYRAVTGYRASDESPVIVLSQLDSQFADYFDVYIREGERDLGADNTDYKQNPWPWRFVDSYYEQDLKAANYMVVIDAVNGSEAPYNEIPLDSDKQYTVCVVARNGLSDSSPVYRTFGISNLNLQFMMEEEYRVSMDKVYTGYSAGLLEASGDYALSLWSRYNSTVMGNVVDVKTGQRTMDDFQVSTGTEKQRDPAVTVQGNRAFAVWKADFNSAGNYDIRGRIFDIETGPCLSGCSAPDAGVDFAVSTSYDGNDQDAPRIVSSGNMALAVWSTLNGSSEYEIRGRIISMLNGPDSNPPDNGTDFPVSTTSITGDNHDPIIGAAGDNVIAVWSNEPADGIRGRIIDITDGPCTGSCSAPYSDTDVLISQNNSNSQLKPSIAVSEEKDLAIVVWESNADLFNNQIVLRIIDLTTGDGKAGTGDDDLGGEYVINSTNDFFQGSPQISISGDYAFITWTFDSFNELDTGGIRGRVLNIETGEFVGNDFIVIKGFELLNAYHYGVMSSNGYSIVVWANKGPEVFSVFGRSVRLGLGDKSQMDKYVINTYHEDCQLTFPRLVSSGNNAVVMWNIDYGSYIMGRSLAIDYFSW